MRKDIIELYEPFYQYTKQPSDSPEWRELRDLVDELIKKIDRPKGKWEDNAIGYSCNLCGRTHIIKDNYCPCCGAEMGEE